jgi:hypothetical protein
MRISGAMAESAERDRLDTGRREKSNPLCMTARFGHATTDAHGFQRRTG